MRISSEEMPFSSEFGEQRKEKKYISIYISFYYFFSIARVARMRKGSKNKRKPTKKDTLSCGRKKINHNVYLNPKNNSPGALCNQSPYVWLHPLVSS